MNGDAPATHEPSRDPPISAAPRDPVCGMTVDPDGKLRSVHEDATYVFCGPGCKAKFDADPERYLGRATSTTAPSSAPPPAAAAAAEWTCPMHPQVVRSGPGICPICGMALEPRTPIADGEEESPELADMTRRFRVGLAFTLPLLILGMGRMIPRSPLAGFEDLARTRLHEKHRHVRALGEPRRRKRNVAADQTADGDDVLLLGQAVELVDACVRR